MAGLSLSYCQLIKIVLSQIGGSPLQQTYTQLSQGSRQVIVGTGIPTALAEVKSAIDTITDASLPYEYVNVNVVAAPVPEKYSDTIDPPTS